MPFCPNCGNKISDDDFYCSKCGANVRKKRPIKKKEQQKGKRIVASISCGLLSGFFAGWGLSNLELSHFGFAIVVLVAWYAYSQSKTPAQALSTGLYLTGIFIVLTPLMIYIPFIFSAITAKKGFAGLFYLIGGVLGIMVWGFVFFIFAIATWIIAYLVSRKEKYSS